MTRGAGELCKLSSSPDCRMDCLYELDQLHHAQTTHIDISLGVMNQQGSPANAHGSTRQRVAPPGES